MIFNVCLLFTFLNLSLIYSDGCLKIPTLETCLTCLSSYYEKFYLTNLKIAATLKETLTDSDCILRENIKKNRTIYILNSDCPDCNGDAIYFDLPTAFVEESKIAARYLNCSLFQ
jgi:hypothetical protein